MRAISMDDVRPGDRVMDDQGRTWERTSTAWRGLRTDGTPTGDVQVDRAMRRRTMYLVAVKPDGPAPPAPAVELALEPSAMPAPGIYPGVPYEVYAAWPGVRSSHLKSLDHSPLHYQHAMKNPKCTKALSLGTAAHCATHEPERFARDFAVWDRTADGGNAAPRRGKAWDEFQAEHAKQTIITADEAKLARAIATAVRSHKAAMRYLDVGEPEVSMLWQHGAHTMQARPDWQTFVGGRHVLVGLKTSRDCRMRMFGPQAVRLGYDMGWAIYHDGFEALTGERPLMKEIVVDSAAPHAVIVYNINDDVLARGRSERDRLLALLADCRETDYWPGPEDGEVDLELPAWAYGVGDVEITYEGEDAA